MIKTCSAGHNEVCWEHSNHPQGCPVCSLISHYADVCSMLRCDKTELTCKLRDANIEIEKWKMKGNEEFSTHMNSEKAMSEQIEKLKESREISRNFAQHHMEEYEKMEIKWRQRGEEIEKLKKDLADTVERSNFAIREDGRNIRIAVERGKRIKELEKKIFHLEGELKCAFDHRQSHGGGEHEIMRQEYFAMRKQRDELLVKVEELEKMDRSSAASGTLMAAKQKIFTLESQVCDLLEQNASITMNAKMSEDGYLILEVRRLNARIEELLVELEKQA